MTKERLKILLQNALESLEETSGCLIMGTDLEYDLGITQEEYDEIMNRG